MYISWSTWTELLICFFIFKENYKKMKRNQIQRCRERFVFIYKDAFINFLLFTMDYLINMIIFALQLY